MDDFRTAARRIVDDYLQHEPIEATLAGVHDHDDRLPDLSADGFAAADLRAKAYLATLARFAPDQLWPDERIDHALLVSRFETRVREHAQLHQYRHDPSSYAGTSIGSVYLLLAHDFAPLRDRLASIESRLRGIPALMEAARANLESAPAVWIEIAREEVEGGIAFLRDDVAHAGGDSPSYRRALDRAVEAFEGYRRFLDRELTPHGAPPFAIGRELFDFKLRHEHLLPHDADTLRAFGENALRTTVNALEATARSIDAGKPWTELVEILRTDHPDATSLLDEYRRGVSHARDFVLDRALLTMPPDEHLDVVETPAYLRPTIPYAAYLPPGPFEKRQHGLYYVTPLDERLPADERAQQLLGHNRYGMLLTNVHESYPGHHVQLLIANRRRSLLRKLLENTVLIEGWALYCEQLVLDEGMTTDPRARLFQLKDQLWRACRVIIDVELHTGTMTFDEAVEMLVGVAHLERPNAIGEVRRYTQSPTQPMSYLTGKQQILDLRERERARLGSAFDLRRFHDRLLSFGSIPVALIERDFGAATA